MRTVSVIIHRGTRDADFKETEHPRAGNGEFATSAGGKSTKTKPAGGKTKFTQPLDGKEEGALAVYGEGNSYVMNKYLRDPKAGKAELKKQFGARAGEASAAIEKRAKVIDGAIAKSRLEEPVTLYRGVTDFKHVLDQIAGAQQGKEVSFDTFTSTSKSEKWAKDFTEGKTGSGLIQIEAPKGAPVLDMAAHSRFKADEQEMLIGRKSKYAFDRYDEKTKTVFLKLLI